MSQFIDECIRRQFDCNAAIQVHALIRALESARQSKALDAVKQKILGQIGLAPFIADLLPVFGLEKSRVDQSIAESIANGAPDLGAVANYYSVLNPTCIERFGISFPRALLAQLKPINP